MQEKINILLIRINIRCSGKKQPGTGQPQDRKKKGWALLLAPSLNGNLRSSSDRTFRAPGTGEVRGIDEPLCWSLVGDFEDYDWWRVSLNSTSEISGHWTLYIFSLWQFTWLLVVLGVVGFMGCFWVLFCWWCSVMSLFSFISPSIPGDCGPVARACKSKKRRTITCDDFIVVFFLWYQYSRLVFHHIAKIAKCRQCAFFSLDLSLFSSAVLLQVLFECCVVRAKLSERAKGSGSRGPCDGALDPLVFWHL